MHVLRLWLPLLLAVCVVSDASARVVFVDNRNPSGDGSSERPYATLAEAERASTAGDVVYVAEGNAPYAGSLTLKRGQMLIGEAFGLDIARDEFHATFTESAPPPSQGPGPVFNGSVFATGDNVIAGCTFAPVSGVGISVFAPQGKVDVRKVFFRPGARATAISIQSSDVPITIDAGSVISDGGSGIVIEGGRGDVVIDHFPFSGTFTNAVMIQRREGGKVTFGSAAPVKVESSTRDAVFISGNKSTITFDAPLRIVSNGGRGLFVATTNHVTVAGISQIDATNATALEVHDTALDATFDHISATGVPPGKLNEGIIIDKSRGKLAITGNDKNEPASGGTIRNAQVYGIRVVQSAGVPIANVDIIDSGSSATKCPADIVAQTNVRCAAGLYLRHVSDAKLSNIRITGGAVGVNTNNARNITFETLDVRNTGATATDPAVLMQESGGTMTLSRCNVADGSGGQFALEQRFNAVTFVIDRCTIGAPQRPMASAALFSVRVAGAGSADIRIDGSNFRENVGSAIEVEARDTSRVSIAIEKSTAQSLGASFLDVTARQSASARVAMHGTRVVAPGSSRPLVAVTLAGTAQGCADISGNELVGSASVAPMAVNVPACR